MKKRLTFDRPVKFGKIELTSVTVREPMCEDELAANAANLSGTQGEQELRLTSIVTGISFEDLRAARAADLMPLRRVVMGFLASGPETSVEEISETGSETSAAPPSS